MAEDGEDEEGDEGDDGEEVTPQFCFCLQAAG